MANYRSWAHEMMERNKRIKEIMTKTDFMKLDENGKKLIHHFESCSLIAYHGKADMAGLYTIGWGNTFYEDGSKVKKGDVISQERADELFNIIVRRFESDVNLLVTRHIKQHEFNALVSFAYNLGSENLRISTLLKKVNENAPISEIKVEFIKWNKANGKVVSGLVRRRKSEAYHYETGQINFFI